MPFTPLHAALGETTTSLDFSLVERACVARVTERAELDWKQKLPMTAAADDRAAKEAQQAELAKDIAAMANSGGGMIVYGVAEARVEGTSAADRVVPVGPVDERTVRVIRQVAGNLIYPPVTGIELYPIAPEDASEEGVLVLLVPDSPDAPHLIHSKNRDWFGVPYRHGPDTEWMVERQIADAYRTRQEGRRRRLEEFDDRFARFIASCGVGVHDNWIVAMALPETPLRRPRDLQLGQADRIIKRAWGWPWPGNLGPKNLTVEEVTRRGLQRYLRTGRRNLSALRNADPRARIEVHGDGSVAVGFSRAGAFRGGPQPGQVAIPDVEQTGLDLFALLWATRTSLGVVGDYVARIAVEPTTQVFRRLDPHVDDFQDFDESHRVLGYGPADGPIPTDGSLEVALGGWLDLVRDAVNQAGVAPTVDLRTLMLSLHLND
jgi:hypothetical protein